MTDEAIEETQAVEPAPIKRRGRPKGSKNKPAAPEPDGSKEALDLADAEAQHYISRYTKWLRVELAITDSLTTLGARISKEDIVAVSELPSGGCVIVVKAHGAPQPLVFNVATPFVEVEKDITTCEW